MNYGYEILDERTLEPLYPTIGPEAPEYDILDEETLQPIKGPEFPLPPIPTPQFQTEPPTTTAVADIPYEPSEEMDPQYFDAFQLFQKETDPYRKAEAIKKVPANEREKIIKTLPKAEQPKIREKAEMFEREHPTIGAMTKAVGVGVKEMAKGVFAYYDPYQTETGKEALQNFEDYGYTVDDFRDEEGKIKSSKVNKLLKGSDPGSTVIRMKSKAFLDAVKRFEEHPEKREKIEEVGEHIIGFGEYMDPFEIRKYRIEERIQKLKEEGNEYGEAWERGDLSFVISQTIADAALTDDPERAKEAMKLRDQYHKALQEEPEKKKGILKNLLISTMEMLSPMVKTGVKMAVPVVGQVWAGYEWSRQGMGDVYADMIDAGVSHETARRISPIAGIAYAAVEQLQFGQITRLAGNVTRNMAGKSIKKVLLKVIKEKGKDFFREVGEEGIQKFITDVGAEIGKHVDGVSEKKMGEFVRATSWNVLKEMGHAAGPMGLLTLLGMGAGVSKAIIEREPGAPPIEPAPPAVEEPVIEPTPPPGFDVIEPEEPTPVPAKEPGYDVIEPEEKVLTEEEVEAIEVGKVETKPEKITGYRSEAVYGEGYRDIKEVVTHEIEELGNEDVIDYLAENNLIPEKTKDAAYEYVTKLKEKGYDEVVWLSPTKEDVVKEYDVSEETVEKFDLEDAIVISDLEKQGKLVAYKSKVKEPAKVPKTEYKEIEAPTKKEIPVKLSRQQKKKSDKFTQAIQTYESREEGDNLIIDWATNKLNAGDVIQVDQGEMTWTVSEKTISKNGTEYIEFKSGEATQNDFGITKRKNEDWKIINKDDARAAFTFDNRPEYAADNPILIPAKEVVKLKAEEKKNILDTFQDIYKQEEGVTTEEAANRAEESFNDLPDESKKLLNEVVAEKKRLKERLYVDNLTGLKSRDWGADNGLFTKTKNEKGKTIYTPNEIRQVMLDLDNFKKVNDKYGHPVGDVVLETWAGLLNQELSAVSPTVRFGGEEILTFPLTNIENSDIIKRINKTRFLLEKEVFKTDKGDLTGVSFSAGLGNNNKEADEALYAAKDAGRGRTHEYGVEYEEPTKPDTEGISRVRKPVVGEEVTEGVKEEEPAAKAPEKVVPAKEEPEELKEPEKITGKSEAAGQEVQVEPSEAQKEAGNYKKAHIRRDGFDISIENPAGTERSGKDKSGKEWTQKMYADYGYIKGSVGYDKDHVDVFIKPDSPEGGTVYIVNQVDPQSKKFDEHKVMIGYESEEDAKKGYLQNYEKGWQGLGSIVPFSMKRFTEWVESFRPKEGKVKPLPPKTIEKEAKVEPGREKRVREPVERGGPGVREGVGAEEPTAEEVERGREPGRKKREQVSKERPVPTGGEGVSVSRLLSSGEGGAAGRRGDEPASVKDAIDQTKPRLIDYLIENADNIGHGGAVTKTRDNLSAIKILKQIESENRYATPDEQQQLVKYVGWGGLSGTFKKGDKFYQDLKDLLTEEEYSAARRSTLNAHYTSPTVIQSIWNGVVRMGYNGGNVLEPAIGIGHFLGLRPTTLKMAMAGIELDAISGRIAKQLYQNADIRVQGYETFKMPKDYYQAIVSNVPFSDYKPVEPAEAQTPGLRGKVSLHDFYFLKSLYGLRPGGIIAFVTSRHTMDKQNTSIREDITKQGDFIGAIRLPTTAFKENAGTEVVTDIIFIQKRAADTPESALNKSFVESSPVTFQRVKGEGEKQEFVNKYYQENPDMVMGDQDLSGTMYAGDQYNVVLKPEITKEGFSDMLNDAVSSLPQNIISDYIVSEAEAKPQEELDNLDDIKQLPEGSYFTRNGKVYQKLSEGEKPNKITGKNKEKLLYLTKMKENAQKLFASQRAGKTAEAKKSLAKLNIVYDKFYKKYGAINARKNDIFKDDPAVFLLYSLEDYNEQKKTAKKTDLFKGVIFEKEKPIEKTDTIEEALIVSLNKFGVIDIGHISKMMDKDPGEIGDLLVSNGLAFRSPEEYLNGKRNIYVTRGEYLSGNVRKKLEKAKKVAKKDATFNHNVNELQTVIPQDYEAENITIRIDSPVLTKEDISEFIKETLSAYNIVVVHNAFNGQWNVKFNSYNLAALERDYGTERMDAQKILQAMMSGRKPQVFDTVRDTQGNETKHLNEAETAAAQVKAELIARRFKEWIWADEERKERLVRDFNDRFNSFVDRDYVHPERVKNKDAKVKFLGSAFPFPARAHQADNTWRIVQSKRTMLAHEVGSGKTLEIIWGAMESKRLGLIKKPMIVFPNHMVKQWANDFYQAYPNAKILVAQEKDLSKEKRKLFINKIATGDWDAVLIKMGDLQRIPLSPTEEANQIKHIVDTFRGYIHGLDAAEGKSRTVKQLEKKLATFEAKIAELRNRAKKERGVLYYEDLGIDMLCVDEADLFKNLQYYTTLQNVRGLGTQQGSGRAMDLFMKTQYLNKKGGRLVFATGTPISNTLVEAYTMMKYLQPEWLHENGISSFDDWRRMFAEAVTDMEMDNTGTAYRPTSRFSKIVNLPSLMSALRQVWDIMTASMLEKAKILVPGRDLPHKKIINLSSPLTDMMKSFKRYLVMREKNIKQKGGKPEKGADNVLVIIDDGKKAALDLRLFSSKLPDLPESKLNLAVNKIGEIYKKYNKQRYTQLVFIDRPRSYRVDMDGKRHMTFDAIADMKKKFSAMGIPEDEIAWISDKKYDKNTAKQALFSAVREGQVRILIGSVEKMGAGTNVQDRLKAIHHLDAKWRPRDFEQANGRGVRQKNTVIDFNDAGKVTTPKGELGTVEIYNYTAKGSLDTGIWNMLEVKSRGIKNIMEKKENLEFEVEEDYFSSIKELSIEDPIMKEALTLRHRIKELTNFENAHINNIARLKAAIKAIPGRIDNINKNIVKYEKDIAKREPELKGDEFRITIEGKQYDKRKDAGNALIKLLKPLEAKAGKTLREQKTANIGTFAGFPISVRSYVTHSFHGEKTISEVYATGQFQYIGQLDPATKSPVGLIGSLNNAIYTRMDKSLDYEKERKKAEEKSIADAKDRVDEKFEDEAELKEKKERVKEVDKILSERKEVEVPLEKEPVDWASIRNYIPSIEDEGEIGRIEEIDEEPEEPILKAKDLKEPFAFKKELSEIMGMLSPELRRMIEFGKPGKYAFKKGERGAIRRKGDKIVFWINQALTSGEAAITIVHELIGHFGFSNVLKAYPDIYKRLITIYKTQANGALVKRIRREYAQELKDNPEFAEDMVFSEWIAYSLEDYVKNKDRKGVAFHVGRAIRQFLIKIGFAKEKVDDILEKMIGELKTVNFVSPTYVARAPDLKAKEFIPSVSFREEMLDEIYDSVSGKKKGIVRRIFKHEKSYQKIKDRVAADILVPISTRLKHIKPIFKEQLRRFEYNYHLKEYKDTKASQPFLNAVKKMEARDQQVLDYALKNADMTKVREIVEKYGIEKEFQAVRDVLDNIHAKMRDVGFKINYVEGYWPRQVLNYSGLLQEVQDTEEWGIIEQQISKAEEKLKRPLSEKEKAEIVNFFIARPDRIIEMPRAAKKRTVDLIDEKMDKYYDYSMSALIQYIHNMNQSIEIRRFLGMDKEVKAERERVKDVVSVEEFQVIAAEIVNNRIVDIEGGIGEYVMRAIQEHDLTPQQQDELIGILKARFNYRPSGHIVQTVKDIGYITSMGSGFSSFLTQIGDLTWAYYVAGPIKATKALAKAFVGRAEVRKEDIGIQRIAEEFRTSRGLGRILNKIFDLTLLTRVDAIGKEALINGALYRYRMLAKKNDVKLARLLQRTFGFEEAAQVMEELKTNNVTDNVKYLLFTKLLDFQPLALSEMPMKYLKSPGGRLFYMLKTFTIKQLDAFHNESIDVIKEGFRTKNAKTVMKGFLNMAHLAALFIAANAGADELKDWLFGRKPSFSDKVWDNILRLLGLSRFLVWETRRAGPVMALYKLITPPMDIIEAPFRDAWKMFKDNGTPFMVKLKNAETWKIIPFFGKHYYWWFGAGRTREVKRQQKKIPKLNFKRILEKETTTLGEKMTAYEYYMDLSPEEKKTAAKDISGFTKQIKKIKKGLFGETVWVASEKRFVKRGGADLPGELVWDKKTNKFVRKGRSGFPKRIANLKDRLKRGKITENDFKKRMKKIEKEKEEYTKWKEELNE